MPEAYPRYVIPPYILRRIVDRGSSAAALRAEYPSATFRP